MNTKKIAVSILELAVVSEGKSFQQTLHNSLKLAQHAEKYNYKRIWYAEHHNSEHIASSATSIIIGYIAENTTSIRVGSGGIMLPNHSPFIIAEQFGTLAQLYPNRIDLGLGRAPGTDPKTAQAIRTDFMHAAQLFPEEVSKIQHYFASENKVSKVRAPIAEGTDVPIYILGSSTDSAHLAAKKGLPYAFASHFATTHLKNAIAIYREEFKPSRELEKPYSMAGVNVIVGDTQEEADRMFTSVIRMFIGILTGARQALQAPQAFDDELKSALLHPAVQQMLKYAFVGTKEKVKIQIVEFLAETNVDELIVVSNIYDNEARIKSYQLVSEIMQEINQAN